MACHKFMPSWPPSLCAVPYVSSCQVVGTTSTGSGAPLRLAGGDVIGVNAVSVCACCVRVWERVFRGEEPMC